MVHVPEEGHGALSGHSFSQQGLAGAGRSVEQEARPVETQSQQLRTKQRQLHGVQDVLLDLLQAAHLLPPHTGDLETHRATIYYTIYIYIYIYIHSIYTHIYGIYNDTVTVALEVSHYCVNQCNDSYVMESTQCHFLLL